MLHLTGLGKSFAQAECLAGRSIDAASRLTLTSGFDAHTVQLRGSHPMGGLEVVLTRLRGSRQKAALKLTRLNFAAHASLSGGLEVVLTRLRGSHQKAALKLTRLNFATHATHSGGLEVVFTRRRGSRRNGLDAHT